MQGVYWSEFIKHRYTSKIELKALSSDERVTHDTLRPLFVSGGGGGGGGGCQDTVVGLGGLCSKIVLICSWHEALSCPSQTLYYADTRLTHASHVTYQVMNVAMETMEIKVCSMQLLP